MKIIDFICDRCHTSYTLNYKIVSQRKIRNSPNYCNECMKEYLKEKRREYNSNLPEEVINKRRENAMIARSYITEEDRKKGNLTKKSNYEALSDKEKEIIFKDRSNKLKNRWANYTEEDRMYISKRVKEQWKNLNEEERAQKIDTMLLGHKQWFDKLSEECKEDIYNKLHEGRDKFLSGLSEEERKDRNQLLQNGKIEYLRSLSEEDKKEIAIRTSAHFKNHWDSLSDEERSMRLMILHTGRDVWWKNLPEAEKLEHSNKYKIWWKNLPEAEKEVHVNNLRGAFMNWRTNLTREQFQELQYKRILAYNNYFDNLDKNPNKNETKFIDSLNNFQLQYQYQCDSKIKHKDFNKKFSINPVTGNTYISPYHRWDFLLFVGNTNILVDIDGSIHQNDSFTLNSKYTNQKYKMLDYIKFNDSQRLYKTDGLDAYIIECYDDDLKDDTPVLHLQYNTRMTYKDFINTLKAINNLPKIDKSDLKKKK